MSVFPGIKATVPEGLSYIESRHSLVPTRNVPFVACYYHGRQNWTRWEKKCEREKGIVTAGAGSFSGRKKVI